MSDIRNQTVQGDKSLNFNIDGSVVNLHVHQETEQAKSQTSAGFYYPTGSENLPCVYYNLIVGFDPSQYKTILMPRDRVLTEYIDETVKARFGGWSVERMNEAKKYPAIIIDELRGNSEGQQGVMAEIQDVFLQENAARIIFQPLLYIPMSFLREYAFELAIEPRYELHRRHWTIKQADIFFAFDDAALVPETVPDFNPAALWGKPAERRVLVQP